MNWRDSLSVGRNIAVIFTATVLLWNIIKSMNVTADLVNNVFVGLCGAYFAWDMFDRFVTRPICMRLDRVEKRLDGVEHAIAVEATTRNDSYTSLVRRIQALGG